MKRIPYFTILLLWFGAAPALSAEPAAFREGIQAFIDQHAGQSGHTREALERILGRARYRQDIIDAMNRPAEAKPWHEYRKIFLTRDRIKKGVDFWAANADLLQQAADEYGVPPEIIVAIIGVETRYGGYMGSHRVLDALSTLAFAYPRRADFFRDELEAFLRLVREQPIDPLKAVGSYAGAMGKPQFIPTSYLSFATDFDQDGAIDLFENNADIIGSVGHYFARHHWQPGASVAIPVHAPGDDFRRFIGEELKPAFRLGELKAAGIEVVAVAGDNDPAQLLALEQPDGEELWAILHNFYVITRYNRSNLYAMAVFQLSGEIRAARERRLANEG